jgi:hypothetical protein
MTNSLSKLAAAGGTDPVSVPLAGKTVRVKPPMDWRDSAFEALRSARFGVWAQSSLVNDLATAEDGTETGVDDTAVWAEIDPTYRQILEFLAAYEQAGGIGLGE